MTERPIGCEEALRLLATYLDHELDQGDEVAVSRHLETCRSCFSRLEFEKRLKVQLSQLRRAPVGAGLEQRIRNLLQDFGVALFDPSRK
jgi:anti-sigma factor RsiW